jgi:hypothetical protein
MANRIFFFMLCIFALGFSQEQKTQLFGFYPHWARIEGYFPQELHLETYDQILYGYYVPNSEGTLVSGDKEQDQLLNVLDLTQKNKQTLWLCVGGYDMSQEMSIAAQKKSSVLSFAQSISSLAQKGVGGFVIDWTQIVTERNDSLHRENLLATITDTIIALKKRNISVQIGLYVPMAEIAKMKFSDTLLKKIDKIFINSEEQMGLWSKTVKPLSDIRETQKAIAYWNARGFKSEQIIVTLPAFAKSFDLAEKLGDKQKGFGSGTLGYFRWHELFKQFKDRKDLYKTDFDTLSVSNYAVGNEEIIVYLTPQSLVLQSDILRSQNQLYGIMLKDATADKNMPESLAMSKALQNSLLIPSAYKTNTKDTLSISEKRQ